MRIIPRRWTILCTVDLCTKGGGRRQRLWMKGRFRKTTRQYSGPLRAAPGTERHRLTELHRRFNGEMNSASVSLFSTRETRWKGEKGKKEIQTGGDTHYYFCPLSCWCTACCPEVRNRVHMAISHWNCLCTGTDGSLWGDPTDAVLQCSRDEMV